MAVDNAVLSGNLLIEVDETNLVPGQDLQVYPGKVFRRQGGAPGQAIFGTKFPNVSNENLQLFDKARQLSDEATGLPSFAHGQTGVTGTGRTAAGISMLMGAAAGSVKTVIKNFDDYKKFMPRLESADLIMDTDTLLSYIFNIRLPMNIKYKYKIKIHMSKKSESTWLAWETIDWEENSIEETWGQWYLTPYGINKEQVLVQYQVYTDPGYIPFGFKWLVDVLTKNSLPETVGNLKKWVEQNEN